MWETLKVMARDLSWWAFLCVFWAWAGMAISGIIVLAIGAEGESPVMARLGYSGLCAIAAILMFVWVCRAKDRAHGRS